MQEWELDAVFIDAETLKKPGERLPMEQLASRLSDAIIDAVNERKSERWEMVRMEFASGKVTIHFKRPPRS